jgi:two-component system sensor histidine kinase QseC
MAQPISLRSYLVKRLFWLIVPVALAGIAVHWYFESRLLRDEFDKILLDKASTLATLVTEQDGDLRLEFADEYMPHFSREKNPFYFQIWLPDGEVLERSYSLGREDLPFRSGPLERPATFGARLADGAAVRCVGVDFPVRHGSHPQEDPGTAVVVVLGADMHLLSASLRRGFFEVLFTGLTSLVGIALVVLLALRKGVRLLQRVADDIDSITPASLAKPLDESRAPVEIRPIVESLNLSLQTIQSYVERERHFNSDVAHELRTPIAELRAAADVARRWPDGESARGLPEHVQETCKHMGGLVESLLELATLEASDVNVLEEEFDLAECIAQVIEQAERKGPGDRTVVLEAPEILVIRSQPRLWELASRNLLDNALSYSPPGSEVHVRVQADQEGVRLCFSNVNASMDEDGLARCTDRLWRASKAGDDGRHFGLGLSIVRAAAEKLAHQFSVALRQGRFHACISKAGAAPPAED